MLAHVCSWISVFCWSCVSFFKALALSEPRHALCSPMLLLCLTGVSFLHALAFSEPSVDSHFRSFSDSWVSPAEGLGARHTKREDVWERCVAPGQWRVCFAFAAAHRLLREITPLQGERQECEKCRSVKRSAYFAGSTGESIWCRQCELQRRFVRQECKACRKSKGWDEYPLQEQVGQLSNPEGPAPRCLACHPDYGEQVHGVQRDQRPRSF